MASQHKTEPWGTENAIESMPSVALLLSLASFSVTVTNTVLPHTPLGKVQPLQ